MLRIHDADHYFSVRKFAEESFSPDGISRWENLYRQLKILADFTECSNPDLDNGREFRKPYPFDENWPLELTGTDKSECRLFKDFAPYSFYWECRVRSNEPGVSPEQNWKRFMNGGLIFHGSHDNGGDGGAPTFSVNISPSDGWSIHT